MKTARETNEIYERVRDLCAKSNSSILKLYRELHGKEKSEGNLATWKKGNFTPFDLMQISKKFNITIDFLIKGEEKMSNNSISGNGNIAILGSPNANIDNSEKNFICKDENSNDKLSKQFLDLFNELTDLEKNGILTTMVGYIKKHGETTISTLIDKDLDRKHTVINEFGDLIYNDNFIIFLQFMNNIQRKDIAYILEQTWCYLEKQTNEDGSKKYNMSDLLKGNKITKLLFKID